MRHARFLILLMLLAGAAAVNVRARQQPAAAEPRLTQGSESNPLTGTYREKENKDQEIGRKILAATKNLDGAEREKVAKEFYRVLSVEPLFAIEQYATTVTINYPTGKRVPFEADGRLRHFRVRGAGDLGLRANIDGLSLTIEFTWPEGDRLRLVYEKSADGRQLTLTRSAASRAVPLPVTVTSQYETLSPRAARNFNGLLE